MIKINIEKNRVIDKDNMKISNELQRIETRENVNFLISYKFTLQQITINDEKAKNLLHNLRTRSDYLKDITRERILIENNFIGNRLSQK